MSKAVIVGLTDRVCTWDLPRLVTLCSCCFQYLFLNMQKLTAGHEVPLHLCIYWTCTALQYTVAVLREKRGQLRAVVSGELQHKHG